MSLGEHVPDSAAELSTLVPAYNESATISQTLDRVVELEVPADGVEVVVIDDGPTGGDVRDPHRPPRTMLDGVRVLRTLIRCLLARG